MTDEQAEAIAKLANCCGGIAYDIYCAMLEAAPVPPVAQAAADDIARLTQVLGEINGCFEAARVEGLNDVLANSSDSQLVDLVNRRLMWADYKAVEALSAAPTKPSEAPADLTDAQKAAPELLAALQAILPYIPTTSAQEGGAAKYSANVDAADKVRAAIAKATGRQA